MKIKDGFLLRQVAGCHVVVPVGALDFDGVITLNETGVLIWSALQKETTKDELINLFLEEYDVSREIADRDVEAFLLKLREADLLQ
jgi:hypothetical protein